MVTSLNKQAGRRYRQFGSTLALVANLSVVGTSSAATPTVARRRYPQFGRTLALVKTLDSLGVPSGGGGGGGTGGFSRAQAVNNTMEPLTQSTARNVMIFMVLSSDHVTGASGLTLTVTISKDGAAFASISPVINDRGNGWYSVGLTSGNTDTLGDLAFHITASTADPCDLKLPVEAARTGIVATNNDKTGYSLTQAFPSNFSSLSIDANGRVKVLTGITKNVAYSNFMFLMTDSSTHGPKTGLGSAVTATYSLDGSAFNAIAGAVSEVSGGWYKVNLLAAEVNGSTVALRFTGASADDTDISFVASQ